LNKSGRERQIESCGGKGMDNLAEFLKNGITKVEIYMDET
jgi:hypothetical protein